MLPGVARALVGVDIAWVFQPYLACCAAAVALCLYSLMEELVSSARIRALLAFVGRPVGVLRLQPVGRDQELTAAFLLALGVALAATILTRRPARWRELLPLALAAGALIQTLGWARRVGWCPRWRSCPCRGCRGTAREGAATERDLDRVARRADGGVRGSGLGYPGGYLRQWAWLFSSGQSTEDKLGNLIHPLSAFQLAGIWPVGDFRLTPPTLASALLIGFGPDRGGRCAVPERAPPRARPGALRGGRVERMWRGLLLRRHALGDGQGTGDLLARGATRRRADRRWMLRSVRIRRRWAGAAGVLVIVALAGGVLWSNVLAYHDVTLAPRPRLAELAAHRQAGRGQGADVHRRIRKIRRTTLPARGAPVQMSEHGVQVGELEVGDLDAFALSRLEPYRSIVTALARGKPSTVDLSPHLAGPLLPALAAPNAPFQAHSRARPSRSTGGDPSGARRYRPWPLGASRKREAAR